MRSVRCGDDGTITTREMFPDLVKYAVTPWRLAVGCIVLAPLRSGYQRGVLNGSCARVVDATAKRRSSPESGSGR